MVKVNETIKGSCLCNNINYEVNGSLRPVCYCHCGQCRKTSGHFVAATQCELKEISIDGEVTWYASSSSAQRGFCAKCGSQLFWKPENGTKLSIFAGSLDNPPSSIKANSQLFSSAKSDYYDLPDVEQIGQETLKR